MKPFSFKMRDKDKKVVLREHAGFKYLLLESENTGILVRTFRDALLLF